MNPVTAITAAIIAMVGPVISTGGPAVEELVRVANVARFGFNAQGQQDFTLTNIYTNAAKSVRNVFNSGRSTGANYPAEYVALVNGLPQAACQIPIITQAGTTHLSGLYKIRFKGQATVGQAYSTTSPSAFTYDAGTGYSTGTWDLTSGSMVIAFSNMSADFDLRTLEVIRPGYDFGGPKYTTEWVKLMTRGSFLRYMDWMGTNGSGIVTHPGLTRPALGQGWGDMIDLSNDLQKDAWFCIPVMMPNAEVQIFLNDVKNQLNPSRKVLLEYGNELWNTSGGFSLPHTYIATTYAAKVYQNLVPLNWGNLPGNPYETAVATSDSNSVGDWRIRRVSNEVYVKHSGVQAFRTGQRFYVANVGGGAATTLMPAVGSYITITVTSANEFKFSNAGADAAETILSRAQRPQCEHAPYLSFSKTSGVVRIVHDGSLTIGATVGVTGFGTYSSLQETDATGFKQYVPNIIDSNTFEITLATAGTNIALVTNPVSSTANHFMVITDTSVEMVQGMSPGTRVYEMQQRYIVLRTRDIKQIAQTVFGAEYASRVTTILGSQRGALNTGASLYYACEWLAFKEGSPRNWSVICDMLSTGDYPQWVAGNYPAIRADETGQAGAQLLMDAIPTREDALRGMVATAKTFGLKTCMYETGFDTAVPSSTNESTGVPVRFRELAHHSPIMRTASKLMIDTIRKYGIDLHCWYGATVSPPKTGSGTTGTAESFFVAELMSSIGDIGSTDPTNAPKLVGIDDYLITDMANPTGSFYKGGPEHPFANHVGTDTKPGVFGPTTSAGAGVTLSYSAVRGGWMMQPTKGVGTNYPWPIIRFVMYAPVAGTHGLYVTCKTSNGQGGLKLRLLVDGVEVGTPLVAAQLSPVSQAAFDAAGSFAETIVPITFTIDTPGIYRLELLLEQPTAISYSQFCATGLRLA